MKIRYSFIILGLLLILSTYGREDAHRSAERQLRVGSVGLSDSLSLVYPFNVREWDSRGRIVLRTRDEGFSPSQPYRLRLRLGVWYQDSLGNTGYEEQVLQTAHDPKLKAAGPLTLGRSYAAYNGVVSLRYEVLSLDIEGGSTGLFGNLNSYIQIEIDEEFYDLPPASVSGTSSINEVDNFFEIALSTMPDHVDGYELEWSYVEAYDYPAAYDPNSTLSPASKSILPRSSVRYDFEDNGLRNSTRVTLPFDRLSYRIRNIYGIGYLIYRYRYFTYIDAQQKDRLYSDWSCSNLGCRGIVGNLPSGFVAEILPNKEHEGGNLNWRYEAVYSEGGRRREMVEYFDGLNKPHQQVSVLESQREAMVSETYYDAYNRPSIQVLPSPAFEDSIRFYGLFNRPINRPLRAYNYEDFQSFDSSNCGSLAEAMLQASGASRYYSPLNLGYLDSNSIHNAYVPNAKGYPFVHTEYELSPDNRVLAQSQPGIDHALGRVGTQDHAQRYWYGNANQRILDRMFGSDVGDSKFYRKMISQDANGQLSVSYLNQQGKVVASALAGDVAPGLDSLGGVSELGLNSGNVFNDLRIEDLGRYHVYSLLVDKAQNYNFNYSVDKGTLWKDYCNNNTLACYECQYDMALSIADACGNTVYDTTVAVGTAGDTLCLDELLTFSFDKFLSVGNYQISKSLILTQASIDSNEARFLSQGLLCNLNFDELLEEELARLNAESCLSIDCESACKDSVGISLWDSYRCDVMCQVVSPCVSSEELMRYDISPGGQYARYIENTNGSFGFQNASISYNLSIYNPSSPYYFKNTSITYTNGAGETVNLSAMTAENLVANWRQEWASALVVLHPEYGCLSACNDNSQAQEYGAIMDLVNSYKEAYALGLMQPYDGINLNAPSSLVFVRQDPLYALLQTAGLAQTFEDSLNVYKSILGRDLSIWELAALMATCDSESEITCLDAVKNDINVYYPAQLDACTSDNAWFYYKALYRNLRGKYLSKLLEQNQSCVLDLGDKSRRFNSSDPDAYLDTLDFPPAGSSAEDYTSFGQDGVLSFCQSNCEALADYWMLRLRACFASNDSTINTSDSLALVEGLIAVCSMGCDVDHLQGSSTLPAGVTTAFGDRSFEDVLLRVLGPNALSQSCTHLLLNKPLPYDDERNIDLEIVADTCACDAYLQARDDLLAGKAPGHITDLDAYMNFLYDDSAERSDLIACRCDQAYSEATNGEIWSAETAIWPSNAQEFINDAIPPESVIISETRCSSCISCGELSPLWQEANDYWASLPESNYQGQEQSDTLFRHHRIVENYINQRSGLNLSYWEFLPFIQNCQELAADSGQAQCNINTQLATHLSVFMTSLTRSSDLYDNACLCLDPYSIEADNKGYRNYSDRLATYVEPNFNRTSCNQEYSFESLSSTGELRGIISNLADAQCSITLYPENPGDSIYMDQIIHLNSLEPIAPENGEGISYRFTITAVVSGGLAATRNITLLGESSCFPLAECSRNADVVMLCQGDNAFAQPEGNDCYNRVLDLAIARAQERYDAKYDSLRNDFLAQFTNACVSRASENLNMDYRTLDYPFTLYYYDRAGNLVKTIPPEGYRPLALNELNSVTNARNAGTTYQPLHLMETAYEYNSYGEVTYQWMPDHDSLTIDTSKQAYSQYFWYDDLGRIKGSRNTRQEQLSTDRHSYTIYDEQNRIIETGEKDSVLLEALVPILSLNNTGTPVYQAIQPPRYVVNHYDVTVTHYDEPWTDEVEGYFDQPRENMQNRISSVLHYAYFKNKRPDKDAYDHGTHYSYDPHGNVKTLIQDFNHLKPLPQRLFYIDYSYDLISGNVKEVAYQKGKFDAFYHRYSYDEDNRIQEVFTSTDGDYWENDARYDYYRHGPLARVGLGDRKIQGLDYAYTIQGWLKGVNSSQIGANDMNRDGQLLSGDDRWTARDAMAMRLDYYQGDYSPIGLLANPSFNSGPGTASSNLYNGNIKAMSVSLWDKPWEQPEESGLFDLLGGQSQFIPNPALNHRDNYYAYDQLNRLKAMWTDNSTRGTGNGGEYSTDYSYDYNGNIENLKRNDDDGLRMDDLSYTYHQNEPRFNNRLENVQENATAGNGLNGDYLGLPGSQNLPIYRYDGIGNLRSDSSEGIRRIEWTAQGKIRKIVRENTSKAPAMYFHYDGMGQRTMKIAKTRRSNNPADTLPPYRNNQEEEWVETLYVRDAQGNVMGRYNLNVSKIEPGKYKEQLILEEHYMYGSDRLGSRLKSGRNFAYANFDNGSPLRDGRFRRDNYTFKTDVLLPEDIFGDAPRNKGKRNNNYLGYKRFELKNHLGNVLTTITDRKQAVHIQAVPLIPEDVTRVLAHYQPEVVSVSDYYPFGSIMPGRNFSSNEYRYGFNGQEKDDEISGSGNSYTAEYWQYDSRLGRRWNIDPVDQISISNYATFANNPVYLIDPKGDAVGDYYSKEGNWLANDGKNDGKVYFADKEGDVQFGSGVLKDDMKFKEWNYQVKDPKLSAFLPHLFGSEGGFNDVKHDRGGATNFGITIGAFKRHAKDLLGVEPTTANLKRITRSQASKIVEQGFWEPSNATLISDPQIGWQYFDAFYNGGASTILKSTLGNYGLSGSGGKIKTLNNLLKTTDSEEVYNQFKAERICYYCNIIEKRPSQEKFRKGWMNRANSFEYESPGLQISTKPKF